MLNQVVLVGRLTSDLEAKELEDGKKVTNMTLAIPRSFKNADGEYETDFVECTLWNNIAENTAEYCKKGDIVGVKGRLQTSNYEKEDGSKVFKLDVVAEKVTFLSSRSKDISGRVSKVYEVEADSREDAMVEALEFFNEFASENYTDNDVTSQIFTDVEELPIEEDNNTKVETNEESKEENTTE